MKNSLGNDSDDLPLASGSSALGALGSNSQSTDPHQPVPAQIDVSPSGRSSSEFLDEDDDHDFEAEGSAATSHHGTGLGVAVGVGLAFVGVGMVIACGISPELRGALDRFAVAPLQIVVLGVVIAGLTILHGWLLLQDGQLAQLTEAADLAAAQNEQTHAQLNYLVESEISTSDGATNSTQDVQQAIHLIKRQEEKINNLSKATKMYGKPLLEITSQISEASRQIAEMSGTLNAVKVIIEQSSSRIESTIRAEMAAPGGGVSGEALEDISRASRESVLAIQTLQRELSQGQLATDGQSSDEVLATTRQSLATIESLKALVSDSLTEQTDKLSNELAQLDRHVEHARAAIMTDIKTLTQKYEQGGGEGGADEGAEFAQTVQAIQHEITALTASIANMQITPAPGDGAAPTPLGGTQNGGKQDSDKGVLSAIAKLKKMRE